MNQAAFSSLLSIMIVLFLLMATGFWARKTGIIDDVASKRLSKLIINIGQPMLIISSLIKIEYNAENTKAGIIMACLGIAVNTVVSVIAFFATKGIKNLDEHKITEYSIVFANVGFIGFPIFRSVFGDIGEFWGSFYVIGFHLFMWTWGLMILARERDDIKLTPRKILINYGTIPCFIGLVIYFSKAFIETPGFLISYTGFLSNLCTPVSVLIIGALLATRSLRQVFCNKNVYLTCAFRLFIIPIFICVTTKLIGLPDYIVLFSTAASALPSASSVTMFAELYDISPGYAAQGVGVTSVISVASLPVIMYIANYIVGL